VLFIFDFYVRFRIGAGLYIIIKQHSNGGCVVVIKLPVFYAPQKGSQE